MKYLKDKKIDKMTDYKEKLFSIIDLYNKISSYDEDSQNINMGNEISTIKIEKQKKVKINQPNNLLLILLKML